jgi:hypothetical protein
MRTTIVFLVLFGACSEIAMTAEIPKDDYLQSDYLLDPAKSESEIISWAKGKTQIERFEIDGKKLLVLLASPPTATYRTTIFVYVGDDGGDEPGWGLLLLRHAGTAAVKVEADKKAKKLTFRSKAGKLLLVLPVENVEFASNEIDQ